MFVLSHHFLFVLLDKLPRIIPSHLFHKSYLWVDLFFVLSGFVLAYVYHGRIRNAVGKQDYYRFMWKRFARIYPLHFFVLGLFVVLAFIEWWLVGATNSGAHAAAPFSTSEEYIQLFTNLFLLQTLHWQAYLNQPAWSISAEWLIYFTIPWQIAFFYVASERAMWLTAIIVLAVLSGIESYFGTLGLDYAGWPMLLRCFGEAALGVIAYQCYRQGYFQFVADGKWALLALIVNGLILALPIPGVISVIGFFWLVLCAARVPEHKGYLLTWSPFVYLGKISFAIYMIHWLVLDILRKGSLYVYDSPLHTNLTLWGEFVVFVLATLSVLI